MGIKEQMGGRPSSQQTEQFSILHMGGAQIGGMSPPVIFVVLQKPPEIKTNSTGQLAIWLERLTPDQEDVSSNPLRGMNLEL